MRFHRCVAQAATLALGLSLAVSEARADVNVPEPSGTAKGVIGGALLGGEAVLLVEAAFDVQPAWAYIVGGAAGAAAGGVGGYFLEQEISPKGSMLMLASGMLLVIPTTVAVLSARAYEVPADYTGDRGPTDAPVADPPQPEAAPPAAPDVQGQPQGAAPAKKRTRLRTQPPAPAALYARVTPPALLKLDSGLLSLSVPAVEVTDIYSQEELRQYGVSQETQVKIPVLSYSF